MQGIVYQMIYRTKTLTVYSYAKIVFAFFWIVDLAKYQTCFVIGVLLKSLFGKLWRLNKIFIHIYIFQAVELNAVTFY